MSNRRGLETISDFLRRYRTFDAGCVQRALKDVQRVLDHVREVGLPLHLRLEPSRCLQEDTVRAFFERFRSLESASLGHFQDQFGRFCREIFSVKAAMGTEASAATPTYNMFSLLGIEDDEDRTHTPFLADLLDPRGTHEQGFLFLREFFRCCSKDPHFVGPPDGYENVVWVVEKQRYTSFGTIDIVISAPAIGYRIAVENKVYAGEQADQIGRYFRWLRAYRSAYPRHALVFLTPDGRSAVSASKVRYVRISYRRDIVGMLRSALPKIWADRVREVIAQYTETIETLSGKEQTDEHGI